MYNSKAVTLLAELSVLATAGMVWACRTYWPTLPMEAVWLLVFGGFFSGGLCTAAYMLTRYSRLFALGEVQE